MQFKRLRVKDFGPIRDLEFEFEKDKVYHFISENDSGKSMILDAMNILCNNIAGIHVKKYISDYAENFYVEGEDFDGNIVKIQRGEESWYKLKTANGEEKVYDKIGSGVPVSIQNIVNVYSDDNKSEKFNFRYSDDKILFMNTTAGENYSFFQKALRTDKVLNSLKKANTLQRGYEKDIDITKSKIEFERAKLEKLPDITNIKDEIILYRSSLDTTMDKIRKLNVIKEDSKKIEKMDKISVPKELVEYDWYRERQKIVMVEKGRGMLENKEKVIKLEIAENILVDIKEYYEECKSKIDVINNISSLIKSNSKLSAYEKLIDKTSELTDQLKELHLDNDKLIANISNLKLLSDLDVYSRKEKALNNILDILTELRNNTGYNEVEIIVEINDLQENLENLRGLTQLVNENKDKILDIEKERSEFMIENRFCPVVANSINKRCPFSNKTLEEIINEVI